jgi:uncharacterized protein YidB (DUF937 family)
VPFSRGADADRGAIRGFRRGADQLKQAVDPDTLEKLTADPGLSVESLCQQLAAHLPKAISHLAADGGKGSKEAAESN